MPGPIKVGVGDMDTLQLHTELIQAFLKNKTSAHYAFKDSADLYRLWS